MRSALIGSTGFVGSNLRDSRHFDATFHSPNIAEIEGQEFDLVISAGTRADSFRINQNGDADRAEIDGLLGHLSRARIRKLVLISTVCVYPAGGLPDEDAALTPTGLTPYGANRLHMEQRAGELFDTTIVRLPQLYGAHLKKGVVHDLIRGHRVEYIRPDDRLQHYDVRRLSGDIDTALAADLPALNVATAALRNDDLAATVFDTDIRGQQLPEPASPFAAMYARDMRTRHAALFGGADGLLQDASAELDALTAFVAQQRNDAEGALERQDDNA